MKRTNIYLDEREIAALRTVSRRTGRPVATLVRQAVDAWLDARGARVVAEDEWTRRFSELLGRRGRLTPPRAGARSRLRRTFPARSPR